MKAFFHEFKEFISRGSVVDLAVGVIIGSAFTAIVTSLVSDVIMPVIGILTKGINFSDLKYVITPAAGDVPENAILYGQFIQSILSFLIVAFIIFVVIRQINRLKRKKEDVPAEPAPTPEDIVLLTEIRDLLKETANDASPKE